MPHCLIRHNTWHGLQQADSFVRLLPSAQFSLSESEALMTRQTSLKDLQRLTQGEIWSSLGARQSVWQIQNHISWWLADCCRLGVCCQAWDPCKHVNAAHKIADYQFVDKRYVRELWGHLIHDLLLKADHFHNASCPNTVRTLLNKSSLVILWCWKLMSHFSSTVAKQHCTDITGQICGDLPVS